MILIWFTGIKDSPRLSKGQGGMLKWDMSESIKGNDRYASRGLINIM